MNQASNISCSSIDTNRCHHSVVISKDLWLGECLGDYLFKLSGTDKVIWISEKLIMQSTLNKNAFEIAFDDADIFSCARLTISNSIRMWLVGHHQITGCELLKCLNKNDITTLE